MNIWPERGERTVGVPQTVPELEQPDAVLGRHQFSFARQIRKVGDAARQPLLLSLADMPRGFVALEVAELAREGELLLIRERLVAKDEDRMTLHRCVDAGDIRIRERLGAIDAADGAGECIGHLRNDNGHASLLKLAPPVQ